MWWIRMPSTPRETTPELPVKPSPASLGGAGCPSSPGAQDFIFAPCCKVYFPVRSGRWPCAIVCCARRKRGARISLHRILKRLDPASAARIHANDTAKVIRAIEVTLAASRPMSEAWKEGREALTGYRVLRLGLDPARPQLYQRINARAHAMFAQGLIEETRELLARYGRSPALDSLGYRQAAQHLDGALTYEQAIAAASQGHRNYAKRQLTWFRREPEVCWLNGFGDDPSLLRRRRA